MGGGVSPEKKEGDFGWKKVLGSERCFLPFGGIGWAYHKENFTMQGRKNEERWMPRMNHLKTRS